VNIDDVISYYVGRVVKDKKALLEEPVSNDTSRREKELRRDQIVLGALRCAKANEFIGE
jgi:hypothetical protein